MVASVLLAGASILLAIRFYDVSPDIPERLAKSWSGLHRLLLNKYWVDEFYQAVFVRGLAWRRAGAALHGSLCGRRRDGEGAPGLGVNGIAWLSRDLVAKGSNLWIATWWTAW